MSTETRVAESAPVGVRILAFMLIAGGIVGIGLSIWMAILGMHRPVFAVAAIAFAAAFGFTAWQGVKLWNGSAGGYRWAKILFAAQIPTLSLGGLTYGFFTLFGFNVQAGAGVEALDFNLGSALNLMYTPGEQPMYVGINLVAAAALAYLLFRTRSGSAPLAPTVRNQTGPR